MSSHHNRTATRRVVAGLTLTAVLCGAAATFGQDGVKPSEDPAKPAARHKIEMPKPIGDTAVAYPSGGKGNAEVILRLVISRDGYVLSAIAETGEEPFATAATVAARRWRFSPAKKDGAAVSAKIRFQVKFVEEIVPEPPPAKPDVPSRPVTPDADVSADKRAREAKAEVTEIVVEGERPPAGVKTMTAAEVRELPGAFGDPFRAIEALPGVTPIVSGVPFFFVRGAPPGNVGYFIDGIRVPYLYHVGLGPSVIHPGLVKQVDLFSGGYPAPFGRFMGGIVSGLTKDPSAELRGEAQVRLVDAGAMVEAPFDNGRGQVLIGGRYSYTLLLLSLFAPNAILSYWDYQARISYELTPRDRISVFSFGSRDLLGEERPDGTTLTAFNAAFHRVDLRYDRRISSRSTVRTAITLGLDRTIGGEDDVFIDSQQVRSRIEVHSQISKKLTLNAGADWFVETFETQFNDDDSEPLDAGTEPDPGQPAPGQPGIPEPPPGPEPVVEEDNGPGAQQLNDLFSKRTDVFGGFYAELIWKPEPGVTVTPGIRFDLYTARGNAALGVDPRLAARFDVTKTLRLVHAFGVAHQRPSFVVPLPGFQPATLKKGLQRSLQYSSGIEADLPMAFTGSLTLFQNAFFNMTDLIGSADFGGDSDDDDLDKRVLGRTYGLELMVRRSLSKRIGGYIAYTLSRSTRSSGRRSVLSNFDRPHVFNGAIAFNLGKRWRLGSRLTLYSGIPGQTTPSEVSIEGVTAVVDSSRLPPFWRIDWRLEKRWRLGKRGYWAFVAEVLNTTLNKEVLNRDCNFQGCQDQEIGPVTIPSLGLEARF